MATCRNGHPVPVGAVYCPESWCLELVEAPSGLTGPAGPSAGPAPGTRFAPGVPGPQDPTVPAAPGLPPAGWSTPIRPDRPGIPPAGPIDRLPTPRQQSWPNDAPAAGGIGAGQPAPVGRPWFAQIEIAGGGVQVRLPRLEAPCRVTLGRPDRARGLAVDLDFERLLGERARTLGIGRLHAAIEGDLHGRWSIVHLGARNAIVVDGGVRLRVAGERAPLRDGSRIMLGTLELRVWLG